jgi:hypothetical protein
MSVALMSLSLLLLLALVLAVSLCLLFADDPTTSEALAVARKYSLELVPFLREKERSLWHVPGQPEAAGRREGPI